MSCKYIFRNSLVLLTSVYRKTKRHILGIVFRVKIPGSLFIYSTQECNLHCRGCISSKCHYQKTDEKMLTKLMKEGHQLGVNSFIFLGGEPMTSVSLTLILDYAKKYSFCNFNIVTNGTLLTQEIVQKLRQLPNVLLFISIDGPKDTHNARRGRGTFELIINNLKFLSNYNIPFFTITTVTAFNYSKVLNRHFIHEFQTYGSLGQIFLPYLVNGCASDLEYELKPDQWIQMSERIKRLNEKTKNYFILDVFEMESRFAGCRAVSRSLAISVDGKVQPCPALMFSMDSLKKKSLLDCLHSPLLHFINDLKTENPTECLLLKNRETIERFVRHHSKEIWSTSDSATSILNSGFQITETHNCL